MTKTLSRPALATFLLAALLLGLGIGPSQLSQAATGSNQSQLNESPASAETSTGTIGQRQYEPEPLEMYTFDDVAEHNTIGNCWTIIENEVYNLTSFISNHPGGLAAISKLCGKDGSEIFNNQHGGGETQADILYGLKIGTLRADFTPCPTGKFFDAENALCTLAPKGYYITVEQSADGQDYANPCDPGSFSTALGSVECQLAAAGYFVSVYAAVQASPCPVGSFSSYSGSSECELAPNGSYVDKQAQITATICPDDKTTENPGSTSLQDCYTPKEYVECVAGKFFSNREGSCFAAPAGYFVGNAGATEATPCSAGYFTSLTGATECLPAPAGTYIDIEAATSAKDCELGSYSSDAASTQCQLAPAGYFVDSTNPTYPTACSPGSFSPEEGSSACQLAPAGYFVESYEAVEAISCYLGTFSSFEGSSECQLAYVGYFVDSEDPTRQTACIPGTYTDVEGSTGCMPAPAGYFVDYSGAAEATPCNLGSFSANEASTECQLAAPGYFADSEDPTSQTACIPGTFTSEEGSYECLPAPAGYYVKAEASTKATACAKGSFSSSEASTECEKAPRGYYVSALARTKATKCASGLTTASTGSTSASACYKPLVQSITGLKAPKALKFKATTKLPLITNNKAQATFKASGSCTAKLIRVTTTVKGKKLITKILNVTASSKAGTCSIALTAPAKDKYLALNQLLKIKVSKTGK